MRRVLLVSPSATPGGAERALVALARRLPEHGWQPSAALLAPGPLQEALEQAGCPVELLAAGRFRQLARTAPTVVRLARRARAADVVLSNMSKGHVYGGAAALLAHRPELWWQHGIPSRSRIELAAARVPTSAIVCVGEEAVAAQRLLRPRRRLVKIHPGTALDELARSRGAGEAVRRSLGWDGEPVVGIVGRLQPWKGQELFQRAAALVARERPDVRFVVVGGAVLGWEGSYPDDLRRLAGELGIADRVHFAGHQADPGPWLDMLDVAVHASVAEPFGLVLVEAMALGTPLVATAGGGPDEIVEDGRSGLLVEGRSPEGLARSVRRLLDDPGLAARISVEGVQRARRFSDEATAAQFAHLLEEVAR